jgi:uncharacterized protein with HEPN domain
VTGANDDKIRRHLQAILDSSLDLTHEVGIPRSAEDLRSGSRMHQLAFGECIRRVGEAVALIDALDAEWLGTTLPEIPWRNIKTTRNRLTHHYWTVDYEILFDIATIHLPAVTAPVAEYLGTADPFSDEPVAEEGTQPASG